MISFFIMLGLLLTLYSMSTDPDLLPGGWKSIPIDSEQVTLIRPYLDRNLPLLFPEIGQKGYEITFAKLQIVNGMFIQLTINTSTILCFDLTLFVDQQNKITISEIQPLSKAKPIMGGFKWVSSMLFSSNDLYRLAKTIQKKMNLLVSKSGTVLVYRKQVVNGIKEHVIFMDSNHNIFSAIIIRKPYCLTDELVSAYQIY